MLIKKQTDVKNKINKWKLMQPKYIKMINLK